jgi:hypothetical protein
MALTAVDRLTMNDSRPPKPKRRWYQFRLRTLLVVTLALGVFFAWIGSRVQRARKNREANARIYKVKTALEKAGGRVGLGYAERPDWLGRLLGDRAVVHVNGVTWSPLRGGNPAAFDGAALVHLAGLTNLRKLSLYNTSVTDAGLKHLEGLTNLRELYLSGTRVTDGGLERLEGLTNLRELYLSGTRVTDAGLERLEGLSNLQWLYLEGTKVTNEGVAKLQKALPNCEIFY